MPLSHVRTTAPLRHTSDLQKTTSRLDAETTPHYSSTQNTELYQTQQTYAFKENDIDHFISWCILSSRSPYNSASKRCNLCFKEKLLIICQPELSSLNKSNELVYCVTIEQSIKIYHKSYFADFNTRCRYVYFVYYTYIYIYIYIYIYSLWYVYSGIYGNNRNPGDKKMAKKEKMLFALKQSWLFYCG